MIIEHFLRIFVTISLIYSLFPIILTFTFIYYHLGLGSHQFQLLKLKKRDSLIILSCLVIFKLIFNIQKKQFALFLLPLCKFIILIDYSYFTHRFHDSKQLYDKVLYI